MRGFQSSVDYRLNFGIGNISNVDSVKIVWNNNQESTLQNLKINSHHLIKEDNMIKSHNKNTSNKQKQILSQSMSNIDYTHVENNFVDFDRERLLFKMNSSEGPCLCTADFNQDGLDDIFIGSAKNQVSKIYYQIKKGEFKEYSEPFENDLLSEDVNCVVDDFDGDGRIDLIVASGGSEFSNFSPELRDRLYLNNGYMNFQKLDNSFASILTFELSLIHI